MIRKLREWWTRIIYRNSKTGEFMSKADYLKADPDTTEKQVRRVKRKFPPRKDLG